MNTPISQNQEWESFLTHIRKSIPKESFSTWFKPMQLLTIDGKKMIVQVPSQFYYDWIEEHYSGIIDSALTDSFGSGYGLEYSILEGESSAIFEKKPDFVPTPEKSSSNNDSLLNKRYTFDNFIEGECNSFARAVALVVAEAPGKTKFNPLTIYGGVGLGKTHLVQAIGNFAMHNNVVRKVVYVSSEKFTVDFINSVKENKSTNFSRIYRSADILIIDDAQFFAGKDRTQMEFFHTFNTLYQAGKQIVLSFDKHPKDLDKIEERLLTRFLSGMEIDIKPPDYETRAAILRKRIEEDHIYISDEVIDFLAINISSNVRELQGALIRLMAHASITGEEIDLPLARRLLKDSIRSKPKNISVETIQTVVGKFYGIPPDLIRGTSRKKEISHARQVAVCLTHELTGNTLKSIGSHFGNRDHSTIIHAVDVIKKLLIKDKKFREDYDRLKHEIEVSSY